MCCTELSSSQIQAAAAVVQAIGAAVIVVLTIRLANATETYATLTKGLLDLNRSEHEREWLPQVHLQLSTTADPPAANLKIINLSRNTFLTTHLFINVEDSKDVSQFELDIPVGPLVSMETGNLGPYIVKAALPYLKNHEWSGVVVAVGSSVTEWSVGDSIVGGPTVRCGRCRD